MRLYATVRWVCLLFVAIGIAVVMPIAPTRATADAPQHGNIFRFPGDIYPNQTLHAFDLTPDGRFAIVLTGILSSVDTATGVVVDMIDSPLPGYGEVHVVSTRTGSRALLLVGSSVAVVKVSRTGKLKLVKKREIGNPEASNDGEMVVNSSGTAAFTIAWSPELPSRRLLGISTKTGKILGSLEAPNSGNAVGIASSNGRTLVFFLSENWEVLNVVDATDPRHLSTLYTVSIPRNGEFSGQDYSDFLTSHDGRYLFFGNSFTNFNVVDLEAGQLVGTLEGNYRFNRAAIFESGSTRMLALQSSQGGTGGQSALVLVDASDPTRLVVMATVPVDNFAPNTGQVAISWDGSLAFVTSPGLMSVYEVPTGEMHWQQQISAAPSDFGITMTLTSAGDRAVAVWANGELGVFPTAA